METNLSVQNPDIILSGDGHLDIEASAEGRRPYIRTAPAYAGGKLDISWMWEGERLPVIVDLETLNASAGLPFVLNHDLKKPMGTIDTITKTASELRASGPLTHDHTDYGANEVLAAKKGFKHRPSVTVYNPTNPKDVIRVGHGERRLINTRWQEGPFFAVYNGHLRNISLESTPGDRESDTSGSILAQAQGVNLMPQSVSPIVLADGSPANPAPAGTEGTPPAPAPSPAPPPPAKDIQGGASPQPVLPTPAPIPTPHQSTPPGGTAANYHDILCKMYERDSISADIMAQALDSNWSPAEALKAQSAVDAVRKTHDGRPNVPGYPVPPVSPRSNEPNGDMIMAAAFLMGNCYMNPDDFDREACRKQGRLPVLALDQKTIDAATSGKYRGVRLSDICAHSVESFYNGNSPGKSNLLSQRALDYYDICTQIQPEIDAKMKFRYADDIRADADTGLSTIGLRNIWALISTATIGKAYEGVSTIWQDICKKASVPNFLKHTVHRVEMVGDFQRLSRIGEEPPHLTYMESQTESQIDTWGAMLTLSRQDIINDEVGVFIDAAQQIGRKAAEKLEMECFAALLNDRDLLFTTAHKNRLAAGASGALDMTNGFKALDNAFDKFYHQKSPGGTPIMVRPSFLLIPASMRFTVERLLSMLTVDGSPKGASTIHHNFPFKVSPYLDADNGLYTVEGSKRTAIPGSNTGWYLFASPNDMPVVVATFLNGKVKPTIERANMRFSLDGIQYKAIMDFEFTTSEFRGGVYSPGV